MENIRYSNTRELYAYLEETRHIREGIWENEITDSQGSGASGRVEQLPATNLHASAERITRKGQMEEFMFLGLRMMEGISRERFAQTFGTQIEAVYQEVLLHLTEEGLLENARGGFI